MLRLSKLDVEAIDIELLMYYILKVSPAMASPCSPAHNQHQVLGDTKHLGEPYDVIVDCTGFTPMSELPLQWLRFCAEIVPKDIRGRFATAHILNPNSLSQKYLRRLYNFMAGTDILILGYIIANFRKGTPFCSSVKTYVSVAQLLEELPDTVAEALSEPSMVISTLLTL